MEKIKIGKDLYKRIQSITYTDYGMEYGEVDVDALLDMLDELVGVVEYQQKEIRRLDSEVRCGHKVKSLEEYYM